MNIQELEKIYNDVMNEYNRIRRFHILTSYTYDLALASVEKNANDNALPVHIKKPSKEDISYSAADVDVKGVQLTRGWISLEEYAQKIGRPIAEIKEKADKGELGRVEIKEGEMVVFWPPENQGNEDLPPVDSKNSYSVKTTIKATVEIKKEAGVEEMISYLGSSKSLEKRTSEASLLLNRETFMLFWTAFEQYIKYLTYALFELFPEQVFMNKKYGKNQMSYMDIFEGSSKFSSMQTLKEKMINCILGDPGIEREAISKQITFIKDCFLENNKNPYDTWYVFRGETRTINYSVLDQLRIIRNALVHKAGEMLEDWDKINLINKPEDNRVVVDEDLLMKTELILKSVSYNLYSLISRSKLYGAG